MPRLGGFVLDVATQAHDKVVDGAGVCVFVEVPDVLQDGLARDGSAAVAYQIAQQLCFHEGELEHLPAAAQLQVGEINGTVIEFEEVRRLAFSSDGSWFSGGGVAEPVFAAQKTFYPRQQDGQIEWLRQVIISAGFESLEYILRSGARGQHQQRYVVLGLAELPGHCEAILSGKHNVQYQRIESFIVFQKQR